MGDTRRLDLADDTASKDPHVPSSHHAGGLREFASACWTSATRSPAILASGFFDGLADLTETTAKDISDGYQNLRNHPAATALTYGKNHWGDFVAGAAISYVKPKGWVNPLMVAVSLRHSIGATFNVAYQASDPNVSSKSLESKYRNAISHEGSNFLSTLPAAMAGGYVGKVGANVTFGKDLGLSDLVCEKYFGRKPWEGRADTGARAVNLLQVRENLLRRLPDAINPPKITMVVSDFDDSVVATKEGAGLGYRQNAPVLSATFNMPEAEVTSALGLPVSLSHNLLHPYVLAESRIRAKFPGSDAEFHEQVGSNFDQIMDQMRRQHGGVYPGVREGLERLRALGAGKYETKIIAYSNGRINDVKTGVEENDLACEFSAVYCQGPSRPINENLSASARAAGDRRVNEAISRPSQTKYIILDPSQAKPGPEGMNRIMQENDGIASQTIKIGNSRLYDGWAAHRAGVRFVHLTEKVSPEATRQIEALNAAGPPTEVTAPKMKIYPPYWAKVDSYEEIADLLTPGKSLLVFANQTLKTLPRWQSPFNPRLPVTDWVHSLASGYQQHRSTEGRDTPQR